MSYSHNVANEYTAIGGTNVGYDAAGNLTADAAGYTYEYDHDNRLTKVKKNAGATTVAEFTYDALGRRIESVDSVAETTTRYYYDGWRVLTETNGSGVRQRHYVYGNYLDEALLLVHDDGHETNPAYTDYYYACDHLYSPAALLDDDGDVVERYEYDAYGMCQVMEDDYDPRSSSSYNNPIAFTGQRLDTIDDGDLQLMFYKNRFYCPTTGRFLQRDPMGVNDGLAIVVFAPSGSPAFPQAFQALKQYRDGTILYLYANLNPILFKDKYGLTDDTSNDSSEEVDWRDNPYELIDDFEVKDPDDPGPLMYYPELTYGKNPGSSIPCIKTMTVEGHGLFNTKKDINNPKASPWAQEFGPGGDPMMGQEILKRCSQFCCVALIRLEGCRIGLAKSYMRRLAQRCPGKRLIVCGCNTNTIDVYERILFWDVLKQNNVCKGGYTCVRGGP